MDRQEPSVPSELELSSKESGLSLLLELSLTEFRGSQLGLEPVCMFFVFTGLSVLNSIVSALNCDVSVRVWCSFC